MKTLRMAGLKKEHEMIRILPGKEVKNTGKSTPKWQAGLRAIHDAIPGGSRKGAT